MMNCLAATLDIGLTSAVWALPAAIEANIAAADGFATGRAGALYQA